MRRFIMFLGLFAFISCGPSTYPSPSPSPCTPGTTGACVCAGGTTGVQTCLSDGSGYGLCVGCPPFDAGVSCPAGTTRCDTLCVSTQTERLHCGACGNACPAGQACVAGRCATTDACASATDCASCTPLQGCGWCGATSQCVRVNTTCTGPAAGTCGSGWACQPTDCPGSTACVPCASGADCLSGQCARRLCDGSPACVPMGRPATCDTIGGVACPAVSAYRACTTDAQCGPRMRCVAVWPGVASRVCAPVCATDADCPSPSISGGVGVTYCERTQRLCFLGCNRAGICDTDLTCRADSTGVYHYCL